MLKTTLIRYMRSDLFIIYMFYSPLPLFTTSYFHHFHLSSSALVPSSPQELISFSFLRSCSPSPSSSHHIHICNPFTRGHHTGTHTISFITFCCYFLHFFVVEKMRNEIIYLWINRMWCSHYDENSRSCTWYTVAESRSQAHMCECVRFHEYFTISAENRATYHV